MPVVGVARELKNTGELQFDLSSFSIRRRFQVVCSSIQDDSQVASSAPGLPSLGSIYVSPTSANVFLRARSYSARRTIDGALVWYVDVNYSTPERKDSTGHGGGGTGTENDQQFQNPLSELPEVDMHTTEREELLTQIYDVNTNNIRPVTNSAGEVYDPPPKTTVRVLTLTIGRNEPPTAPHPALAWTYQNAVNSDAFWGLPPGSWKCVEISAKLATRQLAGGLIAAFLRVTYKFEARQSWDIVILDAGRYWIRPALAALNSAANQDAPFVPSMMNAYSGAADNPAPPGATLSASRFRRVDFISDQGHPIRGALNGQGGPLPDACTFTVVGSTLTVPGSSPNAPGRWVNGLACQVWNVGGSLPPPLQANTIYYTQNITGDGLSFSLATSPYSASIMYSGWSSPPGSNTVNFAASGRAFTGNSVPGISVGMTVTSVPAGLVPAGTTVTGVGGILYDVQLSNSCNITNVPLIFSGALTPVTLSGAGSGINTIKPIGVFGRIRPSSWLPFGALGLPQSFTGGVQ